MYPPSFDSRIDEVQSLITEFKNVHSRLPPDKKNLILIELDRIAFLLNSCLSNSQNPDESNDPGNNTIDDSPVEKALQEGQERILARAAELEALMDVVPAMIWITRDPESKEMYGNRLGYEFLGMGEGANISKTAPGDNLAVQPYRNFRNGQEIPNNELPMQIAAATGIGTNNYEFDLVFDSGVVKNVLGNVVPLYDPSGKPSGAVGAFVDITERKRIESELRVNELRLQTWKEHMAFWTKATNSVFWRLEPDGSYTDPILTEPGISGKPFEENRGWNWIDSIHPDDKEALSDRWHEMINLQTPFEAEARIWHAASQQYRWFSHKAIPFFQGESLLGWVGASIDINDRVIGELALRESENRFRGMADGTPVIIWLTDVEGNNEFVNLAYRDYFGVTLEQVQSGGWRPFVHPEDAANYIETAYECLRERKIFHTQVRLRRNDGEWRWNEVHAQPRLSETGEFLGLAGSALDITEQVHAAKLLKHQNKELDQLNQALLDFTSIASHDLQEPLLKVQAFGRILETQYSEELGDKGKDYITRMISAADRMSLMLKDLLDYTRVTSHGEMSDNVDLNQVVREILGDLEVRILETGGEVRVGELPVISGDPLQMRLLFQNLISNALKYHKPGAPPVVTLSAKASDKAEIVVQDNGIGFEQEYEETIFEPFMRLHGRSKYEGTGMGLPICKKIVERHGGRITVVSNPGEGSVFTVILPLRLST